MIDNVDAFIVPFGYGIVINFSVYLNRHVFVMVNLKRTKVLIRLNDDKALRYRRNILLFIANKK